MMELRVGPMVKRILDFVWTANFTSFIIVAGPREKNKNTISKSGARTFFNITSRDAERKN